jgi:hypothetical protein
MNEKSLNRAATLLKLRKIFKIGFIFVYSALCFIALYAGLQYGYVRMGGGNPSEILQWSTWRHLLDVIFLDP